MATFRRHGEIHGFREKLIGGMTRRGYERDFAERCFRQIEGFADYGFPESHAASFALLVYVSAWLKCHYPAAFACALLNSQPMGFYAPAQIVRDAREHGVAVRPVDVNHSHQDCTLEGSGEDVVLRLGFRQVKGLASRDADAVVAARRQGYADAAQLARRTGLGKAALETLARADAFGSLRLSRRQALWAMRGMEEAPLPLFAAAGVLPEAGEPEVRLPTMAPGQRVAEDYRALRLSLKAHPLSMVRADLGANGFVPCARLAPIRHGGRARIAGLVTARQRPGSAKGVVFITIEDETAIANLIVWPAVFERFRKAVLGASLLGIEGIVQRQGLVVHVVAERLFDLSALLAHLDGAAPPPPAARQRLRIPARNFH